MSFQITKGAGFKAALLGAAAASCLSFGAVAQAQDTASLELEEVVVTGSRIARTGIDSPTPVTILDADSIQLSAPTNLADLLNTLPQLASAFNSAQSTGFVGTVGLNLLDLRNMGQNRTLVLVDGRRHVAGSVTTAAVDINTIPIDMIERVEVITGGASAIYGADAVTGVVNFIQKDDYEGVTARAQWGIPEQSPGDAGIFNVTGGFNFDEDKGNVLVSAEFSTAERIDGFDRDFAVASRRFIPNPLDTGPNDGIGDEILVEDGALNFVNSTGIIWPFSWLGAPGFGVDNGYVITADGGVEPLDFGSSDAPFGETQGGDGLRVAPNNPIQPKIERLALALKSEYEFNEHFNLSLEGKYVDVDSLTFFQPAFDFFGDLFISRDNAYLPAELGQIMDANGISQINLNRFHLDLGQRGTAADRDTYRAVVALDGYIDDNWSYEVSWVWGRTDSLISKLNNRINANFYNAADAIDDGSGNIVCRDADARADGCLPLNLFGFGVADQAAIDYAYTTTFQDQKLWQQVLSGYITGELFELPAGPVSVALGAEYRFEKLKNILDPLDLSGQTFSPAIGNTTGSYDVYVGFVEVSVPVLSDMEFAEELNVDGAVRAADYSTVGSNISWKAGLNWVPTDGLRFRTTRSKAVRAPNLAELFDPLSQNFFDVDDPCDIQRIDDRPNRAANCAALGIPAGFDSAADNATLPGFSGGNPDLIEETAKTWTVGATYAPAFVDGLSMSLDWWSITISDAIGAIPEQDILNRCVDGDGIDNIYCPLITRDPNNFEITSINQFDLNIASLEAAGLDFEVNYSFDLFDGTMNSRLLGTKYLKRQDFPFQDEPDNPDDELGELNFPEWKWTWNNTYFWQDFTFNWELRFIDSTLYAENEDNPDTFDPATTGVTFYNDVQMRYAFKDNYEVYFGVNNLFDVAPPPTVTGSDEFDGDFDNIGRFFYVGAVANF